MSWRLSINRMGSIIDALPLQKYDDQRLRGLPVRLLIKLEMPMILDMMLIVHTIHPMY